MKIYPWQSDVWQHLHEARTRLPHALLLRGRNGIGKFDFALSLAQSLLCQSPKADGQACEVCSSCGWFVQNNHPDYRLLKPEQEVSEDEDAAAKKTTRKSQQISVAQVRELGSFLELSSHRGGGLRIAVIHPAETLNASSANALLKMLEEPSMGVVFILVSHQPQRLLPTIISRCQKVDMPVPETAVALQWLKEKGLKDATQQLSYAGGAPLSALRDAEEGGKSLSDITKFLLHGAKLDPFTTASLCVAQGMETTTNVLQKWIYDLLVCRLTGEVRYHAQYASALQALTKSVNLGLLLDFQRKLDEARKSAAHPLNAELQMESLLLQYTQVFSTKL
jgi:DNA polymerase III subunit delta'